MVGKQRLISTIALIIIGFAFYVMQSAYVFRSAQNGLTAVRSSLALRPVSGDVVFLAIDKKSLDGIGQWPWPRRVHAEIIDRLVAAKTTEIAFDIDFSTSSNPEDDALLAAALERAQGSVILAAFRQAESVDDGNLKIVTNKPIGPLLENAWAASVNVLSDPDGLVRRVPIGHLLDDDYLPSMPALLSGNSGGSAQELTIDYSINVAEMPIYSVDSLLNSRIPDSALAGKKVLIGGMAMEMRDTLAVPVYGLLPGAMVQVLATETILQGRDLHETNKITNGILILLVLLLAGISSGRLELIKRLIACLLIMLSLELCAFLVQRELALVIVTAPIHGAILAFALYAMASELYLRKLHFTLSDMENRDLKRIFSQVITDNFDAILVFGEDGKIIFESDVARELLGDNGDTLVDRTIEEVLPQTIIDVVHNVFRQAGNEIRMAPHVDELSLVRSDGRRFQIEYILAPSKLELPGFGLMKKPMHSSVMCFTARDVTIERSRRKQLEYLARFDPLTGASNRNDFTGQLKVASSGAAEAKTLPSLCVLAFDLNGMSVINGTFGLKFGDQILIQVVERAKSFVGNDAVVSRLGGDRFALLLRDIADDQEGEKIGIALRQLIEEPYLVDHHTAFIRSSVGVAFSWQNHDGAGDFLRAGEIALARARIDSGQHVAIFDDSEGAKVQRALQVERALWQALERDEFELVFQPQVRLEDETFIGAESLVRWNSKTLGPVLPNEFITVAESNGSIKILGRWILERSCRAATRWPDYAYVSVNASAAQLASGDFADEVEQVLKITGLTPSRLVIELTESVLLEDQEICLREMARIRALGVRIALDDFGTGYSSLQYLSQLPIDILKIDRAFVMDLDQSRAALPIIESIMTLTRGLGLQACCEGIETADQCKRLRDIGCQTAQGYYFSKPISQDDFEKALGMIDGGNPSERVVVANVS